MQKLMKLDSLVDYLIRPPKFTYSLLDLGPSIFDLAGTFYQRIDFFVTNKQGHRLETSLWKPKRLNLSNLPPEKHPKILVYLHCNCGSRIEALQLCNRALQEGYLFLAYDSRACGHSQGDYISLGFHEAGDLEAVVTYIREKFVRNASMVLWGRSMGAVTALRYLSGDYKYAACVKVAVVDSPFINLNQVILEMVNRKIGAPRLIVEMFLGYLEPIIAEKSNFKISDLDLREKLGSAKCSMILMGSKADQLVPFKHLEQIYDGHGGRKSIFYISEKHTDERSTQTILRIFKGIDRYLLDDHETIEKEGEALKDITKQLNMQGENTRESNRISNQYKTSDDLRSRSKRKITVVCQQSLNKLDIVRASLQSPCLTKVKSPKVYTKTKKLSLHQPQKSMQLKTQTKASLITQPQMLKQRGRLTTVARPRNIFLFDENDIPAGKKTITDEINVAEKLAKNKISSVCRRQISDFSTERCQIRPINLLKHFK